MQSIGHHEAYSYVVIICKEALDRVPTQDWEMEVYYGWLVLQNLTKHKNETHHQTTTTTATATTTTTDQT